MFYFCSHIFLIHFNRGDIVMPVDYRRELLFAHIAAAKLFRLKGMNESLEKEMAIVRLLRMQLKTATEHQVLSQS